jgi:hypothetical protein
LEAVDLAEHTADTTTCKYGDNRIGISGSSEARSGKRAAIARFLHDGTYRRLADAVAAQDPEIADL